MSEHGELKLVHSDSLGDWYTIEKAEHPGTETMLPYAKDGSRQGLWLSCRISDACVEGSAHEMLAIAKAIEDRKSVGFKRCAVAVDEAEGVVRFWSPRNSRMHGVTQLYWADELAKQIREKLGSVPTGSNE